MHHLMQKGLIEKDILSILQTKGLSFEDANLDSRLKEDLALDSMDKAELIMEVETRFNITIPDSELPSLLSIGDVVNYVDGLISKP